MNWIKDDPIQMNESEKQLSEAWFHAQQTRRRRDKVFEIIEMVMIATLFFAMAVLFVIFTVSALALIQSL